MKKYFSEREFGKKVLDLNEIPIKVYDDITTAYSKYKLEFSKEYPIYCYDLPNVVCGVNERLIKSMIEGYIPDLASQIHRQSEDDETPDNYVVLDFIEFLYENLSDYDEYEYHSFMKHHHLSILETKELKEKFREEINRLFERNGIVFYAI